MSAQHTPTLRELAEAAQMMPWDKSQTDVPHSARYAFKQAITADHYLQLLKALEEAKEKLEWFTDSYPNDLAVSTDEFFANITAAIDACQPQPAIQRLPADDTEGGAL